MSWVHSAKIKNFKDEKETDVSAIHGPIADTDISKIFKSSFLLHYQKYNVFYALPFFRSEIFQIVASSIFCYGFQLI